ncbi:MAG: endo-1,4-beta-xylanase [Firmicutes bacterium]|nr:endo-1,4-beta-xylanase [Bacillota bacterium]
MKLKRAAAALTAAICFVGVFSGFPGIDTANTVQAAVLNDFEINYDGWYTDCENAKLTAVPYGYKSARSLMLTHRKSGEYGVMSDKGLYIYGGNDYGCSIMVRGTKDDNFYLSLRWYNENGECMQKLVDKKAVKADKWTKLKGRLSAPEGSASLTLVITTDTAADFCIDDVTVTENTRGRVYAADSSLGLKDEFAKYFKVGTAVPTGLISNTKAKAIMLKDFNSITPENELKPDYTIVTNGSTDTNVNVSLSSAAAIMDFCVQNNISMRGHTMIWYSQTPDRFFREDFSATGNYVSADVMDMRMESYIKNMFNAIKTQYPNLDLYCYDICNECISDSQERTSYYGGSRDPSTSNWVRTYGNNSFMEKAYTYARRYAPANCKLFYNDYNEYWDHKRDCIYNTCKSLYSKGLLDGIGMQSHIKADLTSGFTNINSYSTAINKYASIGCEVQITELDVDRTDGSTTYSSDDQAEKYKAVFQAAINLNTKGNAFGSGEKYPGKITAVCIWGIDDAHSWINMNSDAGSDPLLYDSSYTPKQAYTTVTAMIPESEWGSGAAEPNEYGWYFDSTFENGTDSWTNRGSNSVESSDAESYVGGKSLYVSNREKTWNGALKALDTSAFKAGTAYSFSANVKYNDGDDSEVFYLKLQYTDSNGKTQYDTIAQATVAKGRWVQLANKSYTIPEGASDLNIYIETGSTTCDFYVDEVIAAVDGTSILGAQSNIPGDLNADGCVDSADYRLAVIGVKTGSYADADAKKAADFDGSGTADADDAELIRQFVLGELTNTTTVDKTAMEELFSGVTPLASQKSASNNSPLYTQRFGADPGVMEYDGRVYVSMTNDTFEYDSNGNMDVDYWYFS